MGELNLSDISENAAIMSLFGDISGQAYLWLRDCSQCGKCTASCPLAESMDILPRQIIRYLQLGRLEPVLCARAPWICATCYACSCRCPNNIDMAALMEALRREAGRQGKISVPEVAVFNRIFLKNIRLFGRSHELMLNGLFNVLSKHFFQDIAYVPGLLGKGKLPLLPRKVKNSAGLARLFRGKGGGKP